MLYTCSHTYILAFMYIHTITWHKLHLISVYTQAQVLRTGPGANGTHTGTHVLRRHMWSHKYISNINKIGYPSIINKRHI